MALCHRLEFAAGSPVRQTHKASRPLFSCGHLFWRKRPRFARVLFDPELDNPADQVCWQQLPKGELRRALPTFVGLELFLERLDPARDRIEPYVFRVSGEMHQMTSVQIKGGD